MGKEGKGWWMGMGSVEYERWEVVGEGEVIVKGKRMGKGERI